MLKELICKILLTPKDIYLNNFYLILRHIQQLLKIGIKSAHGVDAAVSYSLLITMSVLWSISTYKSKHYKIFLFFAITYKLSCCHQYMQSLKCILHLWSVTFHVSNFLFCECSNTPRRWGGKWQVSMHYGSLETWTIFKILLDVWEVMDGLALSFHTHKICKGM